MIIGVLPCTSCRPERRANCPYSPRLKSPFICAAKCYVCVGLMTCAHSRWAVLLVFCGAYGAACGGHSTGATPAACVDQDQPGCGVEDPPLAAATNCRDVRFVKATAEGTGVVACESPGFPPDLYSTRVEQCDGRGLGKTAAGAPIPCSTDPDSDSACPAGATCGANKVCYLSTACEGDADCGTGSACLCAGLVDVSAAVGYNQCTPAECRTDADCNGYSCAVSNVDPCGALGGMYCHTEGDECARHSDCGDRLCAFDSVIRAWHCTNASRICDQFL
jgi:hypothetical protein